MNLDKLSVYRSEIDEKELSKQLKEQKEQLPPELIPYKERMASWINKNYQSIASFLYHRRAKFNINYGKDFYYKASEDEISLSVPYFKEAVDPPPENKKFALTEDQVFFIVLHEFAHLKDMHNMDLAGKKNHLAHYEYESKKRIRDKNIATKRYANLQPTYRHFYNIIDDTTVNYMVLLSNLYAGRIISPESQKRRDEVVNMYTSQFFPLYQKTAPGQGNHLKSLVPENDQDPDKYIYVGENQGDYLLLEKEAYDQGFDWNNLSDDLKRTGQFLTFFMKNQMIGLPVDSINPEQHKLDEDVELVFKKPLIEVYDLLLKKIINKYLENEDQASYVRYIEFMTDRVRIPVFTQKDKSAVLSDEMIVLPNVIEPAAVSNLENISQLSPKEIKIDTYLAGMYYKKRLDDCLKRLGIKKTAQLRKIGINLYNFDKLKITDLFQIYKTQSTENQFNWESPLKTSMSLRTHVNRALIEPIFSMLCILDDTFEIKLPPEKQPGKPPGNPPGKPPERQEEPTWEVGDIVVNDMSDHPNYKRKAIITQRRFSADGRKVESVVIEYQTEEKNQFEDAHVPQYLCESETVYDPDKNLKLFIKKGTQELPPVKKSPKDKRKREYEDKENKPKPQNDKEKKEKADQDIEETIDPFRKYLEGMINNEEREINLEEYKQAQNNPLYQNKQAEKAKDKELLKKLLEKGAKEGKGYDIEKFKKYLQEFHDLEDKMANEANRMAKDWQEILQQITQHIIVVKSKYHTSGKKDWKKGQRYLHVIEHGGDIDTKKIHVQRLEVPVQEIKPKMLRITMLTDNSGSMSGTVEQVKMNIMLLNRSQASLRDAFKTKFKQKFGANYNQRMQLVCDNEIILFSGESDTIKKFNVQNFDFIQDDNAKMPAAPDPDQETLNTILAFQNINPNNGTDDLPSWEEIYADRIKNPKLCELIKSGEIVDVIFQISDGQISNTDESKYYIDQLNSLGVKIYGLAIEEGAVAELIERHGSDNVIPTRSPAEFSEEFGKLIRRSFKEKVAEPMGKFFSNYNIRVK